eukprot:TRINITY_DN17549_c0_g1_i5.p1 TRINITY_DN17549_c0_g1~~TRINITY_DN17549_c0_g1_i5.p1  ORF type:complete len:282 (-),score=77.63 TRINITY_DN17549_c0_g1_i5:139-984(-)
MEFERIDASPAPLVPTPEIPTVGIGSPIPETKITTITASRDAAIRAFAAAADRWLEMRDRGFDLLETRVDILHFVTRVTSISSCSPEAIVVAAVLWHRAARAGLFAAADGGKFPSAELSVTVTVLVASKLHDELHGDNRWYANAAGVSCAELNDLEMALYQAVDWKVLVSPPVFAAAVTSLERIISDSPPQGPVVSMSPSPCSLTGTAGSLDQCSLMLGAASGSGGQANATGSKSIAMIGDEDVADRMLRQVLLHTNSVEEAWNFMPVSYTHLTLPTKRIV